MVRWRRALPAVGFCLAEQKQKGNRLALSP